MSHKVVMLSNITDSYKVEYIKPSNWQVVKNLAIDGGAIVLTVLAVWSIYVLAACL